MHTLNHDLDTKLIEADGRYLNAQELYPLEQYLQSYQLRLQTYQLLSENSEKLIVNTLRKFAQAYPELIKNHGARCKYDMGSVIRYIALSILRNDEMFFKEQMMFWLDTILVAYKRTSHCTRVYDYLHKEVDELLPPNCSSLVHPYIKVITVMLNSHV
ncbi:phycobilisome protein [Roseofilum sp. BLCC_M91]|uniref:Phycobilisome protein n=1 Tax=Roseofilum halophilum BLCC-M91 TaxID=3022259 RepID=A0ABT7BQA3_9CYAN|nr:hypothetical protein [Roseofilum halophilum]MDJ1180473.1 phycobilisome protein [Roseofilum halophilum BLCC-M91]